MNEDMKNLIKEFVEWAEWCGEDAWYIFENTDKAIERFIKHRDSDGKDK